MAATSRTFSQNESHPVGRGIYYECLLCGARLDSSAPHAVACKCYNLILDIDAGRISAKNPDQVRIVEDYKSE